MLILIILESSINIEKESIRIILLIEKLALKFSLNSSHYRRPKIPLKKLREQHKFLINFLDMEKEKVLRHRLLLLRELEKLL